MIKRFIARRILAIEFYLGAAFYSVSSWIGDDRATPADASMALWLDLHPSRPFWW